jgi:amino acid permease
MSRFVNLMSEGDDNSSLLADDSFPLISVEDEDIGITSTEASFHIVCVIAGSGLLQIPFALAQGGWSVLIFLIASGLVNIYTGKKIIKCLDQGDKQLYSYPEIGEAAFGVIGKYSVMFFYNTAMCGTVCLFFILAGINLTALVGLFNEKQWIGVIAGGLIILMSVVKTIKEVGWVSLSGAVASVIVVFIVVVVGLVDYPNYVGHVSHKFFEARAFGSVLGTLCFAFGGNFIYPEVARSMGNRKSEFPYAMTVAVIFITFLYASTGFVGYLTYGDTAVSPILLSLPNGLPKYFSIVIITLHVLLACPVMLFTICSDVERGYQVDSYQSRVLTRTLVIASLAAISVMLPYFSDMINLVGAVSNTMLIFVLPIVCDYVLATKAGIKKSWNELVLGLFIVIIGVVGGGFGTLDALIALYHNIQRDNGGI